MYMADLLLKGHLPYIGSWDHNYPGIVLIHAIHVALFGSSISGFHLFDSLLQLLNAWMVFKLVIHVKAPREAAWLASVGVTIYYIGGGLALYGERDCYLAACIVGAAYFALRGGTRDLLLSASLIGCGLLLRPTTLAYIGVFVLWVFVFAGSQRIKNSGLYLVISMMPIGILLSIYWSLGGLGQFFEATYTYNVELYARPGLGLTDLAIVGKHWFILLGALVGIYVLWSYERRAASLLALLILASIVSLVPVYRFDYHFHPLITLAFVSGSIGWVWLASKVTHVKRLPSIRALTAAPFLMVIGARYVTVGQILIGVEALSSSDHVSLNSSYVAYLPSRLWGHAVQDSISQFLRDEEAVLVQSLTSTMYPMLSAGVSPANRFTNIFNLCLRSPNARSITPMQVQWREEYVQALTDRPPEFIVGSSTLPDHVFNNGSMPAAIVSSFPQLQAYLERNYHPVRQFGGYTIYERKTREGAIAPSP
jgi:hypothetical protein